jgi:iron(III) transport system permease protein
LERMGRQIDKGSFMIFLVVMAFLAVFLFYPILYVFVNSFFIGGKVTFYYFILMFQDPLYRESIINSLMIGLTATVLTSLVAIPLAFLMVRYDFPFKRFLQGLLLVPLVMPPFVGAIGMVQLFARYGAINILLMNLKLISRPIDWFGGGFWGVVVLEALHLYPYLYLNVAAALANIDPTLEEQAESFGSSGFRLFRTITFPLVLPGYFAGAIVVFIWAFTDLGTPLIFDFRKVVPLTIFSMIRDIWANPMGYAFTVMTLLLSVLSIVSARRYVGRKKYEMLSRGHFAPRVSRIRSWKLVPVYAFMFMLIISALTPQISVVLISFAEQWFFSPLPQSWTARFYQTVATHPLTISSIKNSLFYSASSTALDISLGLVVAYLLARKSFPGKDILDSAVMLPLALPGIVLAFGYVAGFSGTALDPFIDPTALLILSYSIRRLPYSVRATYAGLQQTSASLEEASLSVGASPFRTLMKITLPLILANAIAGGIMAFSANMMEVSDSLVLATREPFYPITKTIYELDLRLGDGPYVASALGIVGTIIVTICILVANRLLGRSMGELFRAA